MAGALRRADGRWLMHRRPPGKDHAGMWEFPGGKMEPHELPQEALQRELAEELGIAVDSAGCAPSGFAESASGEDARAIVLLLYTVTEWQGEPQALEGGAVGWFLPEEALALAMPPLDVELALWLFQNR